MPLPNSILPTSLYLKEAIAIGRCAGLLKPRLFLAFSGYYGLGVANAVIEGAGITLLLGLLAQGTLSPTQPFSSLISTMLRWLNWESTFSRLMLLAIVLLALRSLLMFSFQVLDNLLGAYIRRQTQERAFRSILGAPWESIRHARTGKLAGAVTEECGIAAKYLISLARAIYYLIGTVLFAGFALAFDAQFSLTMVVLLVPILILYNYLFRKQAIFAVRQTEHRQGFAADVTERLNNLFQIKVEGRGQEHFLVGRRHQEGMTRAEVTGGYIQAALLALRFLLPALGLLLYYYWTRFNDQDMGAQLHLYAGIGVLGARAATQADNFMSMIGVLTRLGGSLVPVDELTRLPQEISRLPVHERVLAVELENLSYLYPGSDKGICGINLVASVGRPTYLRGPSGSGKTTLVNLIVGVIQPSQGKVLYRGQSGTTYATGQYRPAIGYVTQDINLFQGTVRENLTLFGGVDCDDAELWAALHCGGAARFVEQMGGLNAVIKEGGRSLSGGERRRIGISRGLIGNPDILVLDEVTVGLDQENRREILATISTLATERVVLVVTHDPEIEEENAVTFNLPQSTSGT